jgi:hypothetical protein
MSLDLLDLHPTATGWIELCLVDFLSIQTPFLLGSSTLARKRPTDGQIHQTEAVPKRLKLTAQYPCLAFPGKPCCKYCNIQSRNADDSCRFEGLRDILQYHDGGPRPPAPFSDIASPFLALEFEWATVPSESQRRVVKVCVSVKKISRMRWDEDHNADANLLLQTAAAATLLPHLKREYEHIKKAGALHRPLAIESHEICGRYKCCHRPKTC